MAEASIRVRAVDLGNARDLERLIALLDAYARDPMGDARPLDAGTQARLARDLPSLPTAHGLLAEAGDDAVGVATCFVAYSTFQARPLLNIHDIAVLPEWRGRGVGRRLLDGIEALARKLGCCRLTLEVRADNPRALGLYQRAGFTPAACELFMQKSL
jgi:ribosomal protein S18 acetylase RimI-like enzyme